MNIRKNIDYSPMFDAMRVAMSTDMPQMKLYCELGRLICQRTERVPLWPPLSTCNGITPMFLASPLAICEGCVTSIVCMKKIPSYWI